MEQLAIINNENKRGRKRKSVGSEADPQLQHATVADLLASLTSSSTSSDSPMPSDTASTADIANASRTININTNINTNANTNTNNITINNTSHATSISPLATKDQTLTSTESLTQFASNNVSTRTISEQIAMILAANPSKVILTKSIEKERVLNLQDTWKLVESLLKGINCSLEPSLTEPDVEGVMESVMQKLTRDFPPKCCFYFLLFSPNVWFQTLTDRTSIITSRSTWSRKDRSTDNGWALYYDKSKSTGIKFMQRKISNLNATVIALYPRSSEPNFASTPHVALLSDFIDLTKRVEELESFREKITEMAIQIQQLNQKLAEQNEMIEKLQQSASSQDKEHNAPVPASNPNLRDSQSEHSYRQLTQSTQDPFQWLDSAEANMQDDQVVNEWLSNLGKQENVQIM